jgi:hypothetical protein
MAYTRGAEPLATARMGLAGVVGHQLLQLDFHQDGARAATVRERVGHRRFDPVNVTRPDPVVLRRTLG